MTSVAEQVPVAVREGIGGRVGDVARDIARGGLAGLVAGVIVGGPGGRLVMRLAALLVPDAVGQFTENGNQIGLITFNGSVAVFLIGLFAGIGAAIVWVTISPWIPGTGIRRAVLTMPVAVALGGFFLVQGDNPDFLVLRHDPLVVGSLLALIALLGLAVAWLDDVLNGRLPRVDGGRAAPFVYGVAGVYALLVAVGLLLLPFIIVSYLGTPSRVLVGVALLATGAATVAWWALRLRGQRTQPRQLLLAGRGALAVAVILGTASLVPEVAEALGVR